jgi:hypothetical protein
MKVLVLNMILSISFRGTINFIRIGINTRQFIKDRYILETEY